MKNKAFEKTKYFILDLDGTFHISGKIVDGALDFLNKVKNCEKDFLFFTNNSSNNRNICHKSLLDMGCKVPKSKISVSTNVCIDFLKKERQGKSVYLLGNERLIEDFEEAEIPLSDTNADIVISGFDTNLTYEKLTKASVLIENGAEYFATHEDLRCPTDIGFVPDAGAITAVITATTEKKPSKIFGKPHTETVDYLTSYLNCTREELCFIGDSLISDIKIGYDHNIQTILVLPGITTIEQYKNQNIKATYVSESLKTLSNEIF